MDNLDLCLQVRTANVNTPVARGVVSHIVRQVKIVGCGAGPIQPRAPTLYLHLPHPLAWCLCRRSCFGVRLDSRRASNNKRASCYCVAVELGVISGRLRVCPSGPDNTQFHSLVARTPLLSRDDDVRFRDVCRHRPPALVCSFCWRFSLACCSRGCCGVGQIGTQSLGLRAINTSKHPALRIELVARSSLRIEQMYRYR